MTLYPRSTLSDAATAPLYTMAPAPSDPRHEDGMPDKSPGSECQVPVLTYIALHSIANLGIGVAFLIIWRLERNDRWNLLWSLGHIFLALSTLTSRLYGATHAPLMAIAAGATFAVSTSCLLLGMGSFVGAAVRPRDVIGLSAAFLTGLALISMVLGNAVVGPAGSLVLGATYAVMGVLLIRRRAATFGLVSVLLILRGVVTTLATGTIVQGIDTPSSIANNLVGVATGIALLGAALIDHEYRLQQSRKSLQLRTDELIEANRRLSDLAVDLERRNREFAKARDQAEAASAAKSAFLAQMSHELRTPLNAVIGFSEIIRDGLLGPPATPAYREYAADINDAGRHLLDLVNDVLDLSRGETGRLGLHEVDCRLTDVIERSASIVRPAAKLANVELVIDLTPGTPPRLLADERRLRQILINLLSNAVKFTPAGGKVTLRIYGDTTRGVTFAVEDTGIGMSADEILIALQPFGQVDNSLSRKSDGTGLGLPLTRRLVELHGGTLEIASTTGKGTIVIVQLPARCVRPAPSAAS